jgi:2'-5' RNA ligase
MQVSARSAPWFGLRAMFAGALTLWCKPDLLITLEFCSGLGSVQRMGEQLSLVGVEGAPDPADGLFFAVLPDAAAAADISRLGQHQSRTHGLTGKPILAERLHVSVHNIGDYAGRPRGVVAAGCEAGAAVEMSSFDVAFDRVVSFGGRSGSHPFVLRGGEGVVGLLALHRHLGAALQKVGLWRRVKPQYEPHVTLLYDDRCVSEQTVDTVRWTVREFVLVHSLHGQGRYDFLGRWKLHG